MRYRFALAAFLLVLLGIVTACSSNTTPSGSQAAQIAAPASNSQPAQASPTAMHTVYVTLFDDRLESSLVSFVPGIPYHFVVTNKGHSPYTFAMMSQEMEHMMPKAAAFMVESIMPGQSKTVDYTFSQPMMGMMGQHLEFACYLQGQNQVHMRLPITVAAHD